MTVGVKLYLVHFVEHRFGHHWRRFPAALEAKLGARRIAKNDHGLFLNVNI